MTPSLDSRPAYRARRVTHGFLVGLLAGLLLVGAVLIPVVRPARAQPAPSAVEVAESPATPLLRLTCDRLEFDQTTEALHAFDAVTAQRGAMRVTADRATLHKRSGLFTASGRVHVTDGARSAWADDMAFNANTEFSTITNGRLFLPDTNTWIRGRLFQRFSEMHYRVKDGMVTNCDADDGHVPDWSFSFHDLDVDQGEGVYAASVWLNIRGVPILPLPPLRYPAPGARQNGLLVPTIGVDDVFGVQYRQALYWAVSPSHDLTVAPQWLSKRGQGGDVRYRYVLNRRSRGKWLLNGFRDTTEDKLRAHVTGAHVHHVDDALRMHVNVNYATDRTFLRDLSASGTFRALPSQESVLNVTRRLASGSAYLTAQYLQPLDAGGGDTFQRLPEIGHRYRRAMSAGDTVALDVGVDSTFVHFVRERGFNVSRFDVAPALSVQGLHLGHVVSLRPQIVGREVLYSHSLASSATDDDAPGVARARGTVWLGLEAVTNLSRNFLLGEGHRLRHTMTPRLFYEYVPASRQAGLPRIDAIDTLPKKHVLTYVMRTGFKEARRGASSTTIADFEVAQSYHPDDAPGRASRLSDVWAKAVFDVPATVLPNEIRQFRLGMNAFYALGDREFSQLNSTLAVRVHQRAYVDLGHRRTRAGAVPRRGDIWNPLSFNDVLEAASEIDFFTGGGGVRLSGGWTVGTKVYHDFATGKTPELDVATLYQNPCRCWSMGLYYIRLEAGDNLPERNQINVVFTLRGVGATVGSGTRVLQSLLGPLLEGETGLPWAPR